MKDKIIVRGARQHNLKDVSLEVPRDASMVQAYRTSSAYYVGTVAHKPPTVLEGQQELIAKDADMETYQALLAHARRQVGEARP